MSEIMDKARAYIVRVKPSTRFAEETRPMERIDPEGLRALADLGVSVLVSGQHGFTLSYRPVQKDD